MKDRVRRSRVCIALIVAVASFPSAANGFIEVKGGGTFSCGLDDARKVKCWGWNASGALGDGTLIDKFSPVAVRGLEAEVLRLTVGTGHACVLDVKGEVRCWGNNSHGQLGDGSQSHRAMPVIVNGLGPDVIDVSAGGLHTCAVTRVGGVKCWGINMVGQVGDDTTAMRLAPVDVYGLSGGVVAIDVGGQRSCALLSEGGVKCWGGGASVGDGLPYGSRVPVDVQGLGLPVAALSSGGNHTCALLVSGGVKCWGAGSAGQIGNSDTWVNNQTTADDVVGLQGGVIAITAGAVHSCALTAERQVKCWGDNSRGQLGTGRAESAYTPVTVQGIGSSIVEQLDAGGEHTCVATRDSQFKCWGANYRGMLGNGTDAVHQMPFFKDSLGEQSGSVSAFHIAYVDGVACGPLLYGANMLYIRNRFVDKLRVQVKHHWIYNGYHRSEMQEYVLDSNNVSERLPTSADKRLGCPIPGPTAQTFHWDVTRADRVN
jgi:alpha-tubulin suppressor-like RCC1 family protein